MNRIEPTSDNLITEDVRRKSPKLRYFSLTFYEFVTIIITITTPVAIGIYTALTTHHQAKADAHQLEGQNRIATERREFDLKLAAEMRQQQVYDQFIDDVYTLHKDDELNESAHPWAFANARYRVAHLQWDATRKSLALQFMKEKQLIGRNKCPTGCEKKDLEDIIRLNELNFDYINLTSQTDTLSKMNLKCIGFDQVCLSNATFTNINLNGASFDGSRLNGVKFTGSSLVCATFNETELNDVDFGDSDLEQVQFINVNLTTAKLNEKQRQQISAKSTVTPHETVGTTTMKTKSTKGGNRFCSS
ncbi:unnamed protein product [Rotaria sp. Silwood1]|nr:unnamed protein product [Rotaria sp. Silwood1]CAF3742863.1 unnamed protein product [Rotaria sp. Silwood1]CAF5140752.1 unnamed protein product [Rotaria sp. Silwood1]